MVLQNYFSVLQNDDPRVAETAVVGYSHQIYGQGITYCYTYVAYVGLHKENYIHISTSDYH